MGFEMGSENYDKKVFSFSRLKQPPRKVPFLLKLAMVFNTVGFPLSIFYFLIMVGLLSYAHPVDIMHQYMLDKSGKLTRGKILTKKFVSDESSVDGDYRYSYEYKTPDGMVYTGKSQTNDDIPKDQVINVEYLEKKPGVSRMKGAKKNFLLPYFMILVVFLVYSLKVGQGFLTAGALKSGELPDAEVKNVEEINDGDQTAYNVTLEFTDKKGETRSFTQKTLKKESLTDDPTELVFYDPVNSGNVWPVDEFPIEVEIDKDGEWMVPSTGLAARTYFYVFLFIAPVVYGVVRFFV